MLKTIIERGKKRQKTGIYLAKFQMVLIKSQDLNKIINKALIIVNTFPF